MPEASIIIRTYNEEKHLGNLLRALKRQTHQNFEIIVVDSGSSDRTLEIAREAGVRVIEIESRHFTFGSALNIGAREARGRYLVFASAHVLPVDDEWLANLLSPFKESRVAMVYGRQLGVTQSKFSEQVDFKRLFGASEYNSNVPLYYANNANSAVRRDLWQKRVFDEYLFGLEDIEWAREMVKRSYLVRYAPKAGVYHIHEETWSQVFNRYRREAVAAVRIDLARPPQAKLGIFWLIWYTLIDLVYSFPDYSRVRLEEILRFRYYQWKGSRIGWEQGRTIDFQKDKDKLFYPANNRAVVIKGVGKAEYEEVPLPEIKHGDVLVRVAYVGICRTDLEVYEGTLGYYKKGIASYPIVPGHEYCGTVVRIGGSPRYQERLRIGQKVIGECIVSKDEKKQRQEIGVVNYNGAYSDYVVVPGHMVHKVPDEVDLLSAALVEPLSVVMRGISRIEKRLKPKSRVGIIGAGPIGNFSAQALALEGHEVTVFDRREDRLALIKEKIFNVSTELEHLNEFDSVIEATGSKEALEKVLCDTTVGSTLLLLGFPYGDVQFNFEDVVAREKDIVGSVGAGWEDFAKAINLLPQIDTAPFKHKVIPLKDFKTAWELLREGKDFKIILQPGA